MKRFLTLLGLLAVCMPAFSQSLPFRWAQRTGSYNTVLTNAHISIADMVPDRSGHLLTTGSFIGLVDLNPGPGVDTPSSASGNFLSKKDTAGHLIWVREILNGATLQRMAVDAADNIYLTGFFTGTIDLDPGPGDYSVTSADASPDIFVCKLDSAGRFLWGHRMGDDHSDWGKSLSLDAQGNVYLTGYFSGSPDMDPGPGVTTLSAQSDDPFIIKLTAAGTFVWARNIAGPGADQGRDIAVDAAGNVYVTGSFSGTADFDPGPGIYSLTTTVFSKNAFLLKLDNGGNLVWAYSFGDTNDDWGENVVLDRQGNPVLSGFFSSVMDCDPGPGSFMLTPNYFRDFFTLKLTAAGTFLWAKGFGTPGSGYTQVQPAIRHTLDGDGNVYLTGNFRDTADFDPGAGVQELTTRWDGVHLDWGIFLLLLDSNGNYRLALELEHGGQGNWGNAIQVDAAGQIYTAGTFNDTIDFDPGPGVFLLQSPPAMGGGYGVSAYLLKLGKYLPPAAGVATAQGLPEQGLTVRPNPADRYLDLQCRQMVQATLVNTEGRPVVQVHLNGADAVSMPLPDLPGGVYMLQVVDAHGRTFNRKVWKR